jgi:hypothetical protein
MKVRKRWIGNRPFQAIKRKRLHIFYIRRPFVLDKANTIDIWSSGKA